MQDFAGSTVVHYQGALAALAGALLLGPRIGKFGADGQPNAIPGHNMAVHDPRRDHPLVRLVRLQRGLDARVDFGGVGFFAYVALNTNLAAAAGALGGVLTSWLVVKKPDLSMMLNGAIAALVAITAACAFVAPWAAIVIGFVAGVIVVLGVLFVERIGIDDPVGAVAVHGMAGVWGTLALGLLRGAGARREARHRHGRPRLHRRLPPARRPGARARRRRRVHVLRVVRSLWVVQGDVGIRVDEDVETAGLDVSEHGMWGYPEFYIPVPGGYGTRQHGHLGAALSPRACATAGGDARRARGRARQAVRADVSRVWPRTCPFERSLRDARR